MRFFAYMAFCLLLPCVLLAENAVGRDDAAPAAESEADVATGGGLDSGFERFKTILDRMPFGRPPPGFDPDAPGGASASGAGGGAAGEDAVEVGEMEQQILSSVRVSALNVTPAGIVTVGFTDSSVQPPRNYFMEVGEKRGEWTVVEADPDPQKKTVKLSKNGVEATLKLGGSDPQDGKGALSAGKPALTGRPGMRTVMRSAGASGGAASEPRLTGLQIARARHERRRMELDAEAAQRRQAAEQAQKEREQAAEERKAQRAQLMQIQEELRRQREERQAEEARRAASGDAEQPQG